MRAGRCDGGAIGARFEGRDIASNLEIVEDGN